MNRPPLLALVLSIARRDALITKVSVAPSCPCSGVSRPSDGEGLRDLLRALRAGGCWGEMAVPSPTALLPDSGCDWAVQARVLAIGRCIHSKLDGLRTFSSNLRQRRRCWKRSGSGRRSSLGSVVSLVAVVACPSRALSCTLWNKGCDGRSEISQHSKALVGRSLLGFPAAL